MNDENMPNIRLTGNALTGEFFAWRSVATKVAQATRKNRDSSGARL